MKKRKSKNWQTFCKSVHPRQSQFFFLLSCWHTCRQIATNRKEEKWMAKNIGLILGALSNDGTGSDARGEAVSRRPEMIV